MPIPISSIAGHPLFLPAIAAYGNRLKNVYDENQRLAANFAFHRRWLISMAALSLYWQPGNNLTAGALIARVGAFKIASPNTVRDLLDELAAYQFIRPDETRPGQRPRYWAPSDAVLAAMTAWFAANLQVLDVLDGGARAPRFLARPELLPVAQPLLAEYCIEDARWREPPENVGLLLRSTSGGLVMDQIMILLGDKQCVDGRYHIPALDTRDMATKMIISRTHLQRTVKKVVEAGCIGWLGKSFDSDMWVDAAYVKDYCGWQAVKFHYVDMAFEQALG
ncbi:hypothetical protein FJU08_13875 [Martelella alba]|uniref:Uncharacterized protein n=1 Tax=Martelella alba TaxID=2590451 RepID=A0A506U8K0_9HYPH|nr:hypothetical protein [Martelella alba]TPW29424.1 hypothetical protein FJU08_13875 [Martelella alba]